MRAGDGGTSPTYCCTCPPRHPPSLVPPIEVGSLSLNSTMMRTAYSSLLPEMGDRWSFPVHNVLFLFSFLAHLRVVRYGVVFD